MVLNLTRARFRPRSVMQALVESSLPRASYSVALASVRSCDAHWSLPVSHRVSHSYSATAGPLQSIRTSERFGRDTSCALALRLLWYRATPSPAREQPSGGVRSQIRIGRDLNRGRPTLTSLFYLLHTDSARALRTHSLSSHSAPSPLSQSTPGAANLPAVCCV